MATKTFEEIKKVAEAKAKKSAETRAKNAEDKKLAKEKAQAKKDLEINLGAPIEERKNVSADLKNTKGEDVEDEDYFFGGIVPPGFKHTCGNPVDREDLLEVFNKVFKPSDNILFYKQSDKEVYLIIVPIKFSASIGEHNNSITGDFQKHAISFLSEGSVNADALQSRLERINNPKFIKYSDR